MTADSSDFSSGDENYLFPEDVYRRPFRKLRYALEVLDSLSAATQAWAGTANLRFVLRNSPSAPGAIEVVGRIDELPPVEEWWFRANDAFANLRGALDQLNHAIYLHVSGAEPGIVRFPMARKGSQWRDWRKTAHEAGYPAWLIARYKRFQPYVTHRPTLPTLEAISNGEKHREGVVVALNLREAQFEGFELQVEPIPPRDWDSSEIVWEMPAEVDLDAREFIVSSAHVPGYALSAQEMDLDSQFHFAFVLRIDGEEIPLDSAVQHISNEVLWAACHVVGRELDGQEQPSHLDLSLSTDD